MKTIFIAVIVLFTITFSYSQETLLDADTAKEVFLDEVIISANKVEESKNTVSQQVQLISAKTIANLNSQTSADLIASSGNVFVQKSQQGGGSVVLRGFEANRVLMVVDGVRMNNLIYRGGHLQNIITIDNNMLDHAEIVYGPTSTIYGSDALGGVIHFYTKKPQLANDSQNINIKVNAFSRYGSVNEELTNHVDFNIGMKKFASLTSFTMSDFSDLRGGTNQNPFYPKAYGQRKYYVDRINDKDSLIYNKDRFLQKYSGYSQVDMMQKFLFQQNEYLSHILNIQYSNSSDVPRYDRLTDPKGTGLNSAEWYYGPQKRTLGAYDMNYKKASSFFQSIHFGLSGQDIEESRHNRNFGSKFKNSRTENVQVIGSNLDFQKIINTHNIRFGADVQLNKLKSTAFKRDIIADTTEKLDTRYPDGENTMNNVAFYFSHTWLINEELILNDGFRAGYSWLHSTLVDTATQFHLPYTKINQKMPVYSGSIGVINMPSPDWKLSLLFSTGFRVPNVEDLSSIFGSSPTKVRVPNPNLKPEKTFNSEMGITKTFNNKVRWENYVYYTQMLDAIVLDSFQLNGSDSILYNGAMTRVYANRNKGEAYLYGISSNLFAKCSDYITLSTVINYTYGRIKTDTADYPLDHIPPFMARAQMEYSNKNFSSMFFVNFNGNKSAKDYNLLGEDNQNYSVDPVNGFMPAWFTANIRASYKVFKYFTLQAGVDNIFDTQYRTFASGINAPGRNIFAAVRLNH